MTVEDFKDEQVLNLDENPASNFAVFNDKTAQIGSGAGALTDNGGGKYTVTDAGADFKSLKSGDTFSYTAPDGAVSIIKVKAIQKSGNTVTITEDKDVELEDVFDYVKLEGGYQQEESGEPRASAIELEDSSHSKTKRFDWTKTLGSGDLTATLKASGALTAAPYVKVYLALAYQYVELTLTMKANFDCSASGKLARQSVDLLPEKLAFAPVPGVELTFMPRMEFEASGIVSFSAEMVTAVGFSCDGKNGLVNKSKSPELTKCDFHVEATVYLGLGLEPGVEIGVHNLDIGSVNLDLQVGAQITGKMDASLGTETKPHLCKQCIVGDVHGKQKLTGKLTMLIVGEHTAGLMDFSQKLTDFYYSFDYKEFGWGICPHIGSKPVAQGTCGADLSWSLGEDGTLIVSGTGDMTSWPSASNVPWYRYRDKIKSVTLENGVASVGAYAFSGCKNLVGVTLPEGVTDIGDSAFNSCGNLTEIALPGSVAYIGNSAFASCKNLPGIALPGTVAYLGNYAFSGCSKLASANIPAGITTIEEYTFENCASLKEIEIPGNITVIDDCAFLKCTGLLNIAIPAGVVRIGISAFNGCSYMLRADIQGGAIRGYAFNGCSSLTTVTLGNGVTAIFNDAFGNCSSLKSIAIPDQVKTIGNSAFYGCKNLADVSLGNGVTEIDRYAFGHCTRLFSITFPLSITDINEGAFIDCTRLSKIQFTGKSPYICKEYHSSREDFDGSFKNVVATVHYPANDDTWTESERQNYGGRLTWVPYDPASAQSAEPELPEPSVQEGLQPETSANIPENIEISEPAEEQADIQSIAPQEDPNADAVIIETAPPTAQASTPASASAAGTVRAGASQTKQFTGLLPGGDYVLLVSKDPNGAGLLQPANLLYIAQGRADRRGSLTFSYIPRTDDPAEAKVCGPQYEAKDIGGCTFKLSKDSYVYDGKEKKPEVTVRDGAMLLERNVDYTVSYENNVNAGTASVTVTGSGSYIGAKVLYFTIQYEAKDIGGCTVTLAKSSYVYDGKEKKPEVTVRDGATLLEKDVDYTVSYENNVNAGTATVTVTGSGGYTGAKVLYFTIQYKAKDIGGCTVTLAKSSCVYDGKEKKPEVTVRDGATLLEREVDYTVSYGNNVNAGTASVTVTGSGGYTGAKAVDFTIQKASGAVTASNVTRTASKKAQSFSIGAKAKGGAKLTYKSNAKAVTVNGKGKVTVAKNFEGKATITITAGATANYNKAMKKITVTVNIVPAKPKLNGWVMNVKKGKLTLRWKKAANATGYQIQYATNRNFKGAKRLNVPGGAKTSKTISKLVKGKSYYVCVRAYRKKGGKTTYSNFSSVWQLNMINPYS